MVEASEAMVRGEQKRGRQFWCEGIFCLCGTHQGRQNLRHRHQVCRDIGMLGSKIVLLDTETFFNSLEGGLVVAKHSLNLCQSRQGRRHWKWKQKMMGC